MRSNVNPPLNFRANRSSAIAMDDMDTPGKRVKWALGRRGKRASQLAKELGITRSAVSQWWSKKGATSPADHMPRIASLLNFNEKWLRTGEGSPDANQPHLQTVQRGLSVDEAGKDGPLTLGEVAAGMWLTVSEVNDLNFSKEPSAFPPDINYPVEYQYDLIVRGTSIDRFAADGERVRCVGLYAPNIQLQSGDHVHVQRYRHQRSEVENTIKRAFFVNNKWELRFDSHDPRWRDHPPLILGSGEDEQVEIIGIALWQFRPSPNRRHNGR